MPSFSLGSHSQVPKLPDCVNAITTLRRERTLAERALEMEKVVKTDAEWRHQLEDLAYRVTRKEATERPGTHEDFPEGDGTFTCVCCDAELFDRAHKFESGTGWPSFYQPKAPELVGEKDDHSLFRKRTEVHCNRCDAHLGHVFPDGPEPTGLRYCINGVALKFQPKES